MHPGSRSPNVSIHSHGSVPSQVSSIGAGSIAMPARNACENGKEVSCTCSSDHVDLPALARGETGAVVGSIASACGGVFSWDDGLVSTLFERGAWVGITRRALFIFCMVSIAFLT